MGREGKEGKKGRDVLSENRETCFLPASCENGDRGKIIRGKELTLDDNDFEDPSMMKFLLKIYCSLGTKVLVELVILTGRR